MTVREDLCLSVAGSIEDARRAGFPMTIRAAEFALIIKLNDDEREVVRNLLGDNILS